MTKLLTITETKKMSKTKIETELGIRAKELEALGMDHTSACEFVSSIMNLGIAAHELWHDKNQK